MVSYFGLSEAGRGWNWAGEERIGPMWDAVGGGLHHRILCLALGQAT